MELAKSLNRLGTESAFSVLAEAKKLNKKPHYSKFYDSKSIELVRELYQEDIEYFNYEFEDRKRAIA